MKTMSLKEDSWQWRLAEDSWMWRTRYLYPWMFYLHKEREEFHSGNVVNSIKSRVMDEIENIRL